MLLSEYYTVKKEQLSELTEDAAYDVKILICTALGMTESSFFTNMHLDMTDEQIELADAMLSRRLSGEPLQYILGKWSFMGLEFSVNPYVLIPRQDTETLTERAIDEILRHKYNTVLDMCTGSGCIGITIAKKTAAKVTLCDISEDALSVAKENCVLNGVDVEIFASDMFSAVKNKYDMITINPPYLTKEDMENLQTEVKYEPYDALFGGDDGLKYYRIIAENFREYLNEGGIMLLEIGEKQGEAVKALFPNSVIFPDLCGKDRVLAVRVQAVGNRQ